MAEVTNGKAQHTLMPRQPLRRDGDALEDISRKSKHKSKHDNRDRIAFGKQSSRLPRNPRAHPQLILARVHRAEMLLALHFPNAR